ncbi:MAG: hypothetical protein PHI90_07110 [Clostridia bacterium]|nr:hypothetical protein [Clostridia bacterium]MDD4048573.1 hypothetical protein [Clostridia bacterium]
MEKYNSIKSIIMELNELLVVYGYMIQNAPTEEARRMSELNKKTVITTKIFLETMYCKIFGEAIPDLGEAAKDVPVFADFRAAAQYACKEETEVISRLKNLYLKTESCYHDTIFSCLVEHQLNAMRMLYLLT